MVGQSLQSGFAICHPQPDALPAITMRYFRFPILDESSQNRVYGCHLIFVVGQQRWCSQLTFIAHLACAHWAHGLDQYSTARFRDPRVTRASALIDDAQEKGVHVIVAEKLC